jgi:hypothetical protein
MYKYTTLDNGLVAAEENTTTGNAIARAESALNHSCSELVRFDLTWEMGAHDSGLALPLSSSSSTYIKAGHDSLLPPIFRCSSPAQHG